MNQVYVFQPHLMGKFSIFLVVLLILIACKNMDADNHHSKIVLSGIRDATKVIISHTISYLNEMTERIW